MHFFHFTDIFVNFYNFVTLKIQFLTFSSKTVGQGTGLRPDWVARKFNHHSALFRVQNQVTIPEKADQFIEPT